MIINNVVLSCRFLHNFAPLANYKNLTLNLDTSFYNKKY